MDFPTSVFTVISNAGVEKSFIVGVVVGVGASCGGIGSLRHFITMPQSTAQPSSLCIPAGRNLCSTESHIGQQLQTHGINEGLARTNVQMK
jgi:glucose uptake protein GlcU